MGIWFGTLFNVATVIIGSSIGLFIKGKSFEKYGNRIFQGFGLLTLAIAFKGAIVLSDIYLILGSLVIGTIIGEAFNLDLKINQIGRYIEAKLNSKDGTFARGYVEASLLYCLGSMSIVGSFQSGIENVHTILITKAIMDGISSILLSSKYGIGVGFSAVTILFYQGMFVIGSYFLGPVLSDEIILVVSSVGSILLIGVGLNILEVTQIKIANFLPSIFIPLVYFFLTILYIRLF